MTDDLRAAIEAVLEQGRRERRWIPVGATFLLDGYETWTDKEKSDYEFSCKLAQLEYCFMRLRD